MPHRPLIWFRHDLRTVDNTALHHACRQAGGDGGRGAVAVYTICAAQWLEKHDWADIRVSFILRTLRELKAALSTLNIPLKIIEVPTFAEVPAALLQLAQSSGCGGLWFNDEYEIYEADRDEQAQNLFESAGLEVHRYTDQVVFAPRTVLTKAGTTSKVYTPFKKAWLRRWDEDGCEIYSAPVRQAISDVDADPIPESVSGFDPAMDRADLWEAGEQAARTRLLKFLSQRGSRYKADRNAPSINGTSAISPYLAIGAVSARTCVVEAEKQNHGQVEGGNAGLSHWISEVIWREFYKHILVAYPWVCRGRSFRTEYDRVAWDDNDHAFQAWCEGRTGFPFVDAAMRQLNQTGWMHNRVRMVTAMFLTKDLFQDWRKGERYFMRKLIDGDFANNNGGWQWSASTGTDAQPYFRIYNPTTQGETHDPDGDFIRRFVPELADVEGNAIHEPSRLPSLLRSQIDYPEPIVDHSKARDRVMQAFEALQQGGG